MSESCYTELYFVCQVKPDSYRPDNNCPDNYFPYKKLCLSAVPDEKNYTNAKVSKITLI